MSRGLGQVGIGGIEGLGGEGVCRVQGGYLYLSTVQQNKLFKVVL